MKKFIFIFIALFIFIPNSEALSKFYLGEKVPNMHIESVSDNDIHNGIPFVLRRDDGQFVYCINPFQQLNKIDYYKPYTYNDKIFNLTDEQLEKMNLIAYYGYGYSNHTDLKWYGVSQFLIWKVLGLKDIYFTDTKDGNKIVAYEEEIKEIESLVHNYYTLPSFSNSHFEYTINKNYEIKDLNSVLNNYVIKDSDIDAYIDNNMLYIDTKEEGNYEINFIRKSPIENNYILYYEEGSQSLLYPGNSKDIEFKITIEVKSGSITINKIDSENIKRDFATLEGAIYGIYDEEELITTLKTNEEGIAYIDNLPLGNYYIKEIEPSLGYELDNNIYEINLTNENKDIVIQSQEKVIEGNLIINKYYGNNNNYVLEEDAIFEIYNINDKLIGTYKTENGIIKEKLDYGEYYSIQIEGIEGYNFVDKFNISIKDNSNYIFDLYNKKEILIVDVPNTGKTDYNIFISFIFIVVGLILVLKSQKKIIQ